VAGVNWDIQLMALRFMDDAGMGAVSDAISAIEYAIEHGADIINASWGTEDRSDSLEAILQEAADANVLVAASAGNDGADNDDTPFYPASFDLPNIISVASSTAEDARSAFSNWGKESVHLAAPGSQIKSTIPDNDYGYKGGTSMAAPHVAGAAALFWSLNPSASAEMVKEMILETVTPLEAWEDLVVAGGRLNAGALVDAVIPTGELTVTISPADIDPQWRIAGEETWLDSGESITLQTGEYEIEFEVLEHWMEPDPMTVEVAEDTLTEENVNYHRARGSVEVRIEPESARQDGAQWSLNSGNTWHDSGDSVSRQTGTYDVVFAVLDDWVEPDPMTVDVVKDTVTAETAQYERAQGTLEVSLEPEGARQDGAQWRVVGEETWRDSGDGVTLDTGEYEVEFAGVEDWVEPSPVRVDIAKETVTSETVEYERAQGTLEVNIEPEGVRQDGAQWRVAGEALWRNSGDSIPLDVGEYEVEFAGLDYWVRPEPLSVEVQTDAVTARGVEYERGAGVLEVVLEPPEAVEDGAQWSVDHGVTLHDSGETVELDAGEHWIMFTPVRQWRAPEARRVDVPHDTAATEHAAYHSSLVEGLPVNRPAGLAVLASGLLAAGLAALARTRVRP
ncbi:MAG: S8 family serine peptidase, partial [Candidatus Hydrogenedentota bacterium]